MSGLGSASVPQAAATRPLEHIRVLDLSRMYPGAYCTSLLADLGAEVIKVEAPGAGDGLRFLAVGDFAATHLALNRGKRSMTLNLRAPRARDVLRRLVASADVLVESQRPGSLEQMGLGFDSLREVNSRLIWCSLTGFGPDGPLATAPGHDLTYLGHSGLLNTLTVDERPVVPGSTVSLALTGALAAFGIVSAVSGRERSGVGCRVDATMVDSSMWVIADVLAQAANGKTAAAWGALAARANYRCADGKWITCTATEPRAWTKLVEALEAPDLAGYRVGVDDEQTISRLSEIFASRPAAHWAQNPGLAGGIGLVAEPADVVHDPQVAHRGSFIRLADDGPRVLANPVRIDGATGDEASHARSNAPDLGAHTDEILTAAGFTQAEIAELRGQEVL
jgi:crotonobetainyl-CoA:carnitine CoA-transferase CaiB-like acyl-CoA transferase